MAINYTEKGSGLHRAVTAAGHWLRQIDSGVWISSNDVAVQAIIDTYDSLPDAKAAKVAAIKAEALRRLQLIFPAINSADEVKLLGELWQSIAPAARTPTANLTKAINTYQVAAAAIVTVNGYTTAAEVNAYNPLTSPAWPA
jgi:hypothetical protein